MRRWQGSRQAVMHWRRSAAVGGVPVSRRVALIRWNAASPLPQAGAADGSSPRPARAGTGAQFASGLVGCLREVNPLRSRRVVEADVPVSTVAEVRWGTHERLDFYVQYSVPVNWRIAEHVVSNSVSIQCSPPMTGEGEERPSVHGIVINCFAYHRKVAVPDSLKLLHVFLKRFNSSVHNSLEVVDIAGCCAAEPEAIAAVAPITAPNSRVGGDVNGRLCHDMASRLQCAVAEVTFTPRPGEPLARGLCRAFYNSNGHVHYVVVAAVPADEYAVSVDLLAHAVMAVVESRVESMVFMSGPATRVEEEPVVAGTSVGDGAGGVARPPLQEHSNANLLKINTHDAYSTVGAIKRWIAKELPPPLTNAPPLPLFNGVLRIGKSPRNPHLFLAFTSAEERDAAEKLLTERMVYRHKKWETTEVTERDMNLKHKGQGAADPGGRKRAREADLVNTGGDTAPCGKEATGGSNVSQWEGLPMEEQLARKATHCLGVMKQLIPPRVFGWNTYEKRFAGVYASPVSTGYRNHVNLTFGFDAEQRATVGFLRGAVVDGEWCVESAVDEARHIVTMHPIAKAVAQRVMEVVRAFDELQVFSKATQTGFWRKLQVRHSVEGAVMLDLEVDPAGAAEGVFAAVRDALVRSLTDDAAFAATLRAAFGDDRAGIVSVQYHTHGGTGSLPPDTPRHVLFGGATLTERLNALSFRVSPTAFFQVNTRGTELLLEKVLEVACLTPATTLLDLCCGTGTIGIALASKVRRVIGIELVPSAVENATANATANGITNIAFHCGRVEGVLLEVIAALSPEDREDIVAIVDPPRAGVAPVVLQWIRGTPTIRRVVYISCEQQALCRDCPLLSKPATKKYRGQPFEVVAGFAVDLFPHTPHVEMVAVLGRVPPAEAPRADDPGGSSSGGGGAAATSA